LTEDSQSDPRRAADGRALGGSPVRIASGEKSFCTMRPASMAAGHVLAVEEAATQLLVSLGMRRSEAVRALLPLTRQVLDNFKGLGPRAAWTGATLAAAISKVVQAHLEALQELPQEFGKCLCGAGAVCQRAVLAQDYCWYFG